MVQQCSGSGPWGSSVWYIGPGISIAVVQQCLGNSDWVQLCHGTAVLRAAVYRYSSSESSGVVILQCRAAVYRKSGAESNSAVVQEC